MKKFIAVLMTVVLMLPCIAVGAEGWKTEITVTYNGDAISFDVEPQIIDDRTMVPFRAIFEALGGAVGFDEETGTVSCEKDGKTIYLTPGEYEASVTTEEGEEKITLDVAPVIVDDRTLVPVRFVAEASGAKVNWHDFYREVVIIDTNEWKEELKEKSSFTDALLNTSLSALSPLTSVEESEVKYAFAIKNMGEVYADGEEGPENIDISLNIKATEKSVFDGENTSSFCTMDMDISSFKSLIESVAAPELTEEEQAQIDAVLKEHNINIEIIVDKDYNIYLKSPEIMDLITVFDGGTIKEVVGDKYVLIPLGKMLAEAFVESGIDMEIATVWDLIDAMIYSGEMYTADVQQVEMILDMLADVYSDENITLEEKADGAVVYTIDINKESYIKMVETMLKNTYEYDGMTDEEKVIIDEIIAEQMQIFDAMEYGVSGTFEYKDGIFTKSAASGLVKLTDYLIPGTENVLISILLEIAATSEVNIADSVDAVKIPTDVFDITQ